MKIRVLVYRIGKPPALEEIDDDLEALQAVVGGHIECCYFTAHLVLVCNEEGLLENLRANRYVLGFGVIVGDFFVAAVEGSDFVSLSDEAIALAHRMVAGDERFPDAPTAHRQLSAVFRAAGGWALPPVGAGGGVGIFTSTGECCPTVVLALGSCRLSRR
jgi:Domain of unknown function (DUF3846)